MKAREFEYHRPETLSAALALLAMEDAVPLAGGQSLMPMMNFRIAAPEVVVDLNAVAGLSEVSVDGGWLTIGAMTRYSALLSNADVARHAPLVRRVLPHVAHAAIRNRGTIGGSCALADPAAELPAVLLALGGDVTVQSAKEARRVASDDFFLGLYETARTEQELITAVHIPCCSKDQRTGFYEVTRRHGDYAMAGCVVSASADLCVGRIAFFGVSDRPMRIEGVESALVGSDGGPDAMDSAVDALRNVPLDGDLHSDEATKRHLAGVALRRAWAEVMV